MKKNDESYETKSKIGATYDLKAQQIRLKMNIRLEKTTFHQQDIDLAVMNAHY